MEIQQQQFTDIIAALTGLTEELKKTHHPETNPQYQPPILSQSQLRFKGQNEIYTPSEGDSNKDPPGEPKMEEKQIYWLDSIKEYNDPFESGLEIPSSKVGAVNFF